MIKQYYKVEFKLTSAMNIGCGLNEKSDSDILLNSGKQPYIPGSSMAGVFRSLLDEKTQKKHMGNVVINTSPGDYKGEPAIASKVIVYDAVLKETSAFKTSIRDCVALDDFKTARTGAKFDFEILEPGCIFVTYLEQDMAEGDDNIALKLVSTWQKDGLTFGSKTMRGLGNTQVISIMQADFDLKTDLEEWLDFNVYDDHCWIKALEDMELNPLVQQKMILNLHLKQVSGISVRKYTTKINQKYATQPDYEQLSYKSKNGDDEKVVPCIPGTTWSGAFRHHLKTLGIGQEQLKDVFGYVKGQDGKKAQIAFSETELTGGKEKMITRNAIDRFTGGTVDGALYTEKYCYDGSGQLRISLPVETELNFKQALAAAITDLHFGMMAVGGLTGVGRGLFEITRINEDVIKSEMTAAQVYDLVLKSMILPEEEEKNA